MVQPDASLHKHLVAWLGLMFLGILNGILRESTYGTNLSTLTAHQISTATGILLFGLFVWWLSRRWPLRSKKAAWIVGVSWLGLTIVFEFIFGRYIMGHPWEHLLADYNLAQGRVWIFVLLWVTVAPRVLFRSSRSVASGAPNRTNPRARM